MYNSGTLNMVSDALYANHAGGDGGAIYNDPRGSLILCTSELHDNNAAGSGGAVENFGGSVAIMCDSALHSNVAGSRGGAIDSFTGGLSVSHTSIYCNAAATDGGGIWCSGELAVTDSYLYTNSSGNRGGGLFFSGLGKTATIKNVSMTQNGSGLGGGFAILAGTVTFTDCILQGNTATDTASDGGVCVGAVNYTWSSIVPRADAVELQ